MPHANAMTYLNDGTLDPACYWHTTIEELRKEPGKQEKVSVVVNSLYSTSHVADLGHGEMVLEEI
jgi:hypothetical protein